MASELLIDRQWLHLLKKILILIFIIKGSLSSQCRIGSIKSGYRLKRGLDQANITPLGTQATLDSCNKVCCEEDWFDYGVYDGSQCYGITCESNTDPRCVLLRDGNAKFTIFKINRKKKKKKKKKKNQKKHASKVIQESKSTKRLHNSNKNIFTKHTHHVATIKKSALDKLKTLSAKTKSHRKHNKRRRKVTSKRDYSSIYSLANKNFLLNTKRTNIQPMNHATSLQPMNEANSLQPMNELNSLRAMNQVTSLQPINEMNSLHVTSLQPINEANSLPFQPVLDLKSPYNEARSKVETSNVPLYVPPGTSGGTYHTVSNNMLSTLPEFKSDIRKDLVNPNLLIPVNPGFPATKTLSTDNQLTYSRPNQQFPPSNQLFSSFIPTTKNKNVMSKVNLTLIDQEFFPKQKQQKIFTPSSKLSSFQSNPEFIDMQALEVSPEMKKKFNNNNQNGYLMNNQALLQQTTTSMVQPVKEIVSSSMFDVNDVKPLSDFPTDSQPTVRDVIPQPEEIKEELITTKDNNIVDVPFSSNLQLPKTSNINNDEGLSQQYISSDLLSTMGVINHTSPLSSTSSLPSFVSSSSLMHPLTRNEQRSYKSMFLQSKQTKYDEVSKGSDKDLTAFDEDVPIAFQEERSSITKEDYHNANEKRVKQRNPANVKKAISEINELRKQIEGLLHEKSVKKTTKDTNIRPISFNKTKIGILQKTFDHQILKKRKLGCVNPLGISNPLKITNDQMTSSSNELESPPQMGRLKEIQDEHAGSWCANVNKTQNGEQPYLQIDLGGKTLFCRIATQGNGQKKDWVKRFRLQFSENGNDWSTYHESGKEKLFVGNEDASDTTYHTLRNPILSKFIRFQPTSWSGNTPCMRVEAFNTTLSQENDIQSRSKIPKGHLGLIIDLDFEKMDEQIVLDRSSFGNNGFMYGGAKTYDSHSSCRHAVKLPLGSDIVIDGSIMKKRPRDAITVTVWLQLNKVDGVHSIFDTVGGHSTHNLGQFHFEVVGGDVRWFHRNESETEIFNIITDHKIIRPMEWNHIAATYDAMSQIAAIYVNGTLRVQGNGNGMISKDWDQRVGIGRHKGVRFLNGQLDEFKMYDKALDPADVADLALKCGHEKYYCGNTLTEASGTMLSPSFPETINGPVQCEWNIEGKSGEVISLNMKQFNLGNAATCGRGTLEVRDRIDDSLIGSYCGHMVKPRRVRSHSNHMYIKYDTIGAFKGENFKIDYYREKKNFVKKTLSNQCKAGPTLKNVTLIGGAKSGNFSDLGYVVDMDDCVDRCCNTGTCDVAFMIDDNCYSVKCVSAELCKVRPAKSSALNPQLAFVSKSGKFDAAVTSMMKPYISDVTTSVATSNDITNDNTALCPHTPTQSNVTLIGGIKSGNFTSRGIVDSFNDCIRYCCDAVKCDVAFMVKKTCFSLQCTNDVLCKTRIAKPSPYNPMVSFMKKPVEEVNVVGDTKANVVVAMKANISPKVLPLTKNTVAMTTADNNTPAKPQTCKDIRVSKIYHDVTLKGGINSGEFTDKGHVTSMEECTAKCCAIDSCNVAFVIKDTCFAVKCKSYSDCELKPAVSDYYNPQIVYVSWSPPRSDLGKAVEYTYKGCWKDFDITAFALPLLEGTDTKLSEPYKKRSDPVNDCASVSQSHNFKIFAIQNGGACFSGAEADQTYQRYGKSEACKAGKGGPFANSVYKSFDDGSVIGLGCWSDLQDRAFRRMEKNDALLRDSIESRADPIGLCSRVAEKMKVKHFALQKGGQCFVAKDNKAVYDKYSVSRKCKYGLGGQMANDVYELKRNFTADTHTARETPATNNTLNTTLGDIEPEEKIYKEETSGDNLLRYVYKVNPPLTNVTLMSAINAGTFEDKGKMNKMDDCVKVCGESNDCDVAFMLSSQCFNVHCYSSDTCKVKPAFSSFYKPQLAYVKRRIVKNPLNKTTTVSKSECSTNAEVSNVTFIDGINAGNFSDMGHAASMDDCKARCCQDKKCHIAFRVQSDCYGVHCYSKESCKTRAAKNAMLFQPQMALIRSIPTPLDESIQQKSKQSFTTTVKPTENDATKDKPTEKPTTALHTNIPSTTPTPRLLKCKSDVWDGSVVKNQTLIGGINAGDFRDHGQVDSMAECMNFCCDEHDCDLSFMIDKDCYTVKCYKNSLCKTRNAKPTTFTPQIAFKTSAKYEIDKSDLSELLPMNYLPTPENATAALAYAAFKSILFGLPDLYNESFAVHPLVTHSIAPHVNDTYNGFNGTTPPVSVPRPSAQATPSFGDPKKHSCKAEPIIYNATLRLGMHSGLFTKLGRVKTMDDCIERCCRSSNADVAYMLGPFCFAVKCRTREMCKPSPAMYSDIKSLNLNPAISFLSKERMVPAPGVNRNFPSSSDATCSDSPITYNVTLRGGVHAGKFTELGEGISMRSCVGKCCDTPLCDVAFMFSDKCYAVGCYDESQCQAVLAKPSSLNPKLAYVTKYRAMGLTTMDVVPSGIEFDVKETMDYCAADQKHGPIYTNKTLFGGMKAGNFSFLGNVNDIKGCLRKCCSKSDCDMAYLVNQQQCFSVKCYSPELCQIADEPLKHQRIEISKLVKKKRKSRGKRSATLAYIAISLIIITSGLTGMIWAALLYMKRSKLRRENQDDDIDSDIPRPDR